MIQELCFQVPKLVMSLNITNNIIINYDNNSITVIIIMIRLMIAFDEVERKPNFGLWLSRVGIPV